MDGDNKSNEGHVDGNNAHMRFKYSNVLEMSEKFLKK